MVCANTFPDVVLSDGAAASASSLVLAYSNSKPTTSMLTPTANPRTARCVGDVVVPRNTVASAAAESGVSDTMTSAADAIVNQRNCDICILRILYSAVRDVPLADLVVSGDPRAIARGISMVEDEPEAGAALVRDIF